MEENTATTMWTAYHISERNGKGYWNRVGIAFLNRDSSINIKLETLPLDGKIQLRDVRQNNHHSDKEQKEEQNDAE